MRTLFEVYLSSKNHSYCFWPYVELNIETLYEE